MTGDPRVREPPEQKGPWVRGEVEDCGARVTSPYPHESPTQVPDPFVVRRNRVVGNQSGDLFYSDKVDGRVETWCELTRERLRTTYSYKSRRPW